MDVASVTSPYTFLMGCFEAWDHGQIIKNLGDVGEPAWSRVGATVTESATPVNQGNMPLNTPFLKP